MNEAKLEIFVDGVWRVIVLKNSGSLKYNKVVNRIGDYTTREISHSNTFTLLSIYENIEALKINIFNHQDLAKSLNSKYPCKYFIDETLFKEGFLIINNTNDEEIKVNFIDKSLTIIEIWSNTTFKQLLIDETLTRPADYQAAIDEMRNYFLDKENPVSNFLGEVGTRGYNLSLFPNNLNAIGDQFQITSSGSRIDNSFNPYQSRPIFNAKAVFDLACEVFGYTAIFDPSVDWDDVARNYIVNKDLNKGGDESRGVVNYTPVLSADIVPITDLTLNDSFGSSQVVSIFAPPPNMSLIPNNIPGWVRPAFGSGAGYDNTNFENLPVIFVPDLETSPTGTITFEVFGADTADPGGVGFLENHCYSVWSNSTPGGNVVFKDIVFQENTGGNSDASAILNKSELEDAPAGGDEFIGLFISVSEISANNPSLGTTIDRWEVSETFLDIGIISFDDNGQFESEQLDLTFAAPDETIRDLLKGLMNQKGILLDIDEENLTIRFFNYNLYKTNVEAGNYSDWSQYLRKYNPFKYNTDYGQQYAQVNNIGLDSPFPGNTFNINLTNNNSLSKYKSYTTNHSEIFKDVTKVNEINNSLTPYIEYENLGIGLVDYVGNLGELTQIDYEGTNIGPLTGLPALANINYALVPSGIEAWYKLVDEAVRSSPVFLLPQDVAKKVDLSEPIYIQEMNGFWIIEEIAEYTNEQNPVVIKLIRMVRD